MGRLHILGVAIRRSSVAILLLLTGCASGSDGGDSSFLDDAIAATKAALDVTNAVAGATAAAPPPPPATRPVRPAATTGQVRPPNGYSQRGAFEDCRTMYRGAGMEALALECERRAQNMGSLR